MNNKSLREWWQTRTQFGLEGKFENGVDLEDTLNKLHYYETALHRLAEIACNRDMTTHEEKRQNSIKNKVVAIAGRIGFKVRFNGDPRGGAIRFILPSGKSNNWDSDTWGIYW